MIQLVPINSLNMLAHRINACLSRLLTDDMIGLAISLAQHIKE